MISTYRIQNVAIRDVLYTFKENPVNENQGMLECFLLS